MSSFSGALCVAAALSFFAPSARALGAEDPGASTAQVPLVLEVQADTSCMSAALVKRRILARSSRVRLLDVSPTEPAAHVRITQRAPAVAPSSREFSVLLELESREGKSTKRELKVRDCSEANDAAALIVVLWLDEAEPAKRADAVAEAPAPADGTATTSGSASSAVAPDETEEGGSRDGESGEAEEVGFRFTIGALAQGSLGPAPGPLFGPALLLGVAYDERSVLSPALRLIGAYEVALAETKADGGTARFSLASLSVDACPLRLGGKSAAVRPCATAVFGALHARGEDTLEPESATRPYYALGGSVVGSAEISSGFGLVLGASVSFPLSRDRFQFAPVVFHEVPAVVGSANLGIFYRFP